MDAGFVVVETVVGGGDSGGREEVGEKRESLVGGRNNWVIYRDVAKSGICRCVDCVDCADCASEGRRDGGRKKEKGKGRKGGEALGEGGKK